MEPACSGGRSSPPWGALLGVAQAFHGPDKQPRLLTGFGTFRSHPSELGIDRSLAIDRPLDLSSALDADTQPIQEWQPSPHCAAPR